jgi:dGTP triphosphohydrolase
MIIKLHDDLEEKRILGLIDDDMYYMLKIRDAAFNCDVAEQKRLMHLKYLEKRQKQKKADEERQKKQAEEKQRKKAEEKAEKEQEKAITDAIEKEVTKKLEKELQKFFSKR